MPVDPFMQFDHNKSTLLKLGNFCRGTGGTSLLAVFNVSKVDITDLVSVQDFTGLESKMQYIFRAHNNGKVLMKATNMANTLLSLSLRPHGWEFFSAFTVTEAMHSATNTKFDVAILGLISHMSGAAAVISQSVTKTTSGNTKVRLTLKALGVLGESIKNPR
jgi:hypothetical protein